MPLDTSRPDERLGPDRNLGSSVQTQKHPIDRGDARYTPLLGEKIMTMNGTICERWKANVLGRKRRCLNEWDIQSYPDVALTRHLLTGKADESDESIVQESQVK